MREAGFLSRSKPTVNAKKGGSAKADITAGGSGEETFFVSREMVENVAREWGVKRMMMDVEYVKM